MTLQESFDSFIFSKRLAGLSEKSIKNYQDFLKPFLCFFGLSFNIELLTRSMIDKYIQSVVVRNLSMSTKATYVRNLKVYLRWCEENFGACFDARTIKVPKPSKRNVRIYQDDDIKMIFDAVDANPLWIQLRNKCIIALMLDSGLRRGEVCSLCRSCVFFNSNMMIVRGKGDKERTVPMGHLTKQFLLAYERVCPYHTDVFFVNRDGSPLTNNAVKLMVSKLAHSLPFSLSAHKLRHNFATNYCLDQYEHNGSIDIYKLMYLMGHEDIETTKRYLHMAYEVIASKGNISHLDNLSLKIT